MTKDIQLVEYYNSIISVYTELINRGLISRFKKLSSNWVIWLDKRCSRSTDVHSNSTIHDRKQRAYPYETSVNVSWQVCACLAKFFCQFIYETIYRCRRSQKKQKSAHASVKMNVTGVVWLNINMEEWMKFVTVACTRCTYVVPADMHSTEEWTIHLSLWVLLNQTSHQDKILTLAVWSGLKMKKSVFVCFYFSSCFTEFTNSKKCCCLSPTHQDYDCT